MPRAICVQQVLCPGQPEVRGCPYASTMVASSTNMVFDYAASKPKDRVSALWSFFGDALSSIPFWWSVCLVSAGILSVSQRHSMGLADGLSYLDMASEAWHSGPSALINGYWSPGYPALISLALRLFRPSPGQEFPLLHLVNFFIFALTLLAFHYFLRNWLSAHADVAEGDQLKKYFVPFAYCTFLWFTLTCIGVGIVSPDLCVATVVFLAAGITCRLSLAGSSKTHYVALGLALGLGYYTKAVMFPLGLALLGLLLLYPPSRGVTRQRLLISLSVFLLTAAPLVTVLSYRVGRPTFGETGRLNYAWDVWGVPRFQGWAEGDFPDAYGRPEHPIHKMMEKPLLLEFSSPIKGTYPLWYDPAYWYAGAKVGFNLRHQLAGLINTAREYTIIYSQMAAFLSGAAVLCIFLALQRPFPDLPLRESWLVIWPLAPMLLYGLVHVESRFLGAFLVLLFLAIYGVTTRRLNRQVAVAVCATVAATAMIVFMIDLIPEIARIRRDVAQSRAPDYQIEAAGLQSLGVQKGDYIAIVGVPFEPYYARYAGLRVVAEIRSTDDFLNLTTAQVQSIAESLAKIGVKAMVLENRPDTARAANWHDVQLSDSGRFSILLTSDPVPKEPRN